MAFSESLKKIERDIQEIEVKTTKIEQSIDTAQARVEDKQKTLKDLSAVEAVEKEISSLIEEKKALEKEMLQFQQEVDYEVLKAKQNNTQVFFFDF